jgi:hypothetical protein
MLLSTVCDFGMPASSSSSSTCAARESVSVSREIRQQGSVAIAHRSASRLLLKLGVAKDDRRRERGVVHHIVRVEGLPHAARRVGAARSRREHGGAHLDAARLPGGILVRECQLSIHGGAVVQPRVLALRQRQAAHGGALDEGLCGGDACARRKQQHNRELRSGAARVRVVTAQLVARAQRAKRVPGRCRGAGAAAGRRPGNTPSGTSRPAAGPPPPAPPWAPATAPAARGWR